MIGHHVVMDGSPARVLKAGHALNMAVLIARPQGHGHNTILSYAAAIRHQVNVTRHAQTLVVVGDGSPHLGLPPDRLCVVA